MKQVLIVCDSCAKVVPVQSIHNWWGLMKKARGVPDMKFAPLCKRNVEEFKGHACSEDCLAKVLIAFAKSVDMKKVTTAKTEKCMSFSNVFGWPMLGDTGDSIGYYRNPEDDDSEDKQDE